VVLLSRLGTKYPVENCTLSFSLSYLYITGVSTYNLRARVREFPMARLMSTNDGQIARCRGVLDGKSSAELASGG